MSDQLFSKVAVITDVHFGRNGNSTVANQDNLDFFEWAIDRARSWGANTCIFMGDYFDNRHSLGVITMNYALSGLDMLNKGFKRTFTIVGNHDTPYREKRDKSSIEIAKYLPNIEIIRNQVDINGVTFLPWLVGDEAEMIKNIKSRYVFSHLEMGGFMMNAKVIMQDKPNLIQADQFTGVDTVFTGHYHLRQQRGRVLYTGNIFPFDFSDIDDEDRGMMLLEWGKEPIFENWPEQPLFKRTNLSFLMDHQSILKPKMTLRVEVDLPMRYDEAHEIRDALITGYDLRKIELTHPQGKNESEQEFQDGTTFESVDQIVEEGLMSIDSNGISKEKLVALYRSL